MKNNKLTRGLICALALAALSTSCIGPFNATRRIHTWNREMDNRWVGEGVFLVFRWLPVYTVASLGDMFIFNSFDFWGGTNPVDPPSPERIKALQEQDDARMTK